MKRRLLTCFISFVMLLTMGAAIPAVQGTEGIGTEETLPVYQASAYYDAAANPTDGSPWTWQAYNRDTQVYTTMTTQRAETYSGASDYVYNASDEGVDTSAYQYLASGQGAGYGRTAVGKYWMNTEMNANAVRKAYSAVRTFTAPQTGNITITAADKDGNSKIIGISKNSTSTAYPLNVRIMKGSEKIWPADAEYAVVPRSSANAFPGLDFAPLTLNVQAGDTLHFEFADTTETNTQWNMAVYWDPVITYNSYEWQLPSYQASDAYVESSNGNPAGQWQWERYELATEQYIKLDMFKYPANNNAPFDTGAEFPLPENETTTSGFGMHNDKNTVAVGKYWMHSSANTTEGDARYYKNNYTVRTFTVPQTGNVTISAEDAEGNSTIMGQQRTSSVGPNVRIMRERDGENTQIWPASGWQQVAGNAKVAFQPLALNVRQGDKLHFELTTDHLSTSQVWRYQVYWDPVVTYNALCEIESFTPAATENLSPAQQFTLTLAEAAGGAFAAEEISITGAGTPAVSSVQSADGTAVSFAFSGLQAGEAYQVTVKDPADAGIVLYRFGFTTMPDTYRASDYYSTGANPCTVDGMSPWQWEAYSVSDDTYARLAGGVYATRFDSDNYRFVYSEPGTEDYSAYKRDGNNNSSTNVGRHWMAAAMSGSSTEKTNYYAVRTFTAPADGIATVSALDQEGQSRLYGMAKPSFDSVPDVRVVLERGDEKSVVWPSDGWESVPNSTMTTTEDGTSYTVRTVDFTPFALQLQSGDKLHFELRDPTANGAANWNMGAYWDPVVAYDSFGSAQLPMTVYCSADGSADGDGTQENPYDFQTALGMAADGGTVMVIGTNALPESFAWPKADKAVTISGVDGNAVLDFSAAKLLEIHCDVTFENLRLLGGSTGEGDIRANGHHVVIQSTVSTDNVMGGILGGSVSKTVAATHLEIYGGSYRSIYGGGSGQNVTGDSVLTLGGTANSAITGSLEGSGYYVYGGCFNGTVGGDCIVTAEGSARAEYLYGSSHKSEYPTDVSRVSGKISVNIEGGSFMNVYAAARLDTDADSPIDAEINMTGGAVEALIGGQGTALTGSITINALGGTVTRRIIGGMYNQVENGGNLYVTGTTTVVLGGGLQGLAYSGLSRGIYPGSRSTATHTEEVSTVIFLDDTYDRLGGMLSDSHHNDLGYSRSKWDYLADATAGGTVAPKSAGVVTVTPGSGYSAVVHNQVYTEAAEINLTANAVTEIVFYESGENPPLDPYMTALQCTQEDGIQISFAYAAASADDMLCVALYDGESLVWAQPVTVVYGGVQNAVVSIPAGTAEQGRQYQVKAFLWNGASLEPLCTAQESSITLQ